MNKTISRKLKNMYWSVAEKRKTQAELRRRMAVLSKEGDPFFYVINRSDYVGLFSYVEIVMRQIDFALRQGYIPVVDMRGSRNPYLEDGKEQTENWWELYFEQPAGYSPEEAYRSGRFERAKEENRSKIPYGGDAFTLKKSRWQWSAFYQYFFKPNETVRHYFEKEYETLMNSDGSNVLGVLVRGTDYKAAAGHPIMPEVDEVIDAVKKCMKRYDRIYLATEEYVNVKRFEAEFPGRVLVNQRMYYDSENFDGKSINEIRFTRENDQYLCGLEYLSSILLLSKCGGLVGGLCGGTVAAVYMNGVQYRDLIYFDKGRQALQE